MFGAFVSVAIFLQSNSTAVVVYKTHRGKTQLCQGHFFDFGFSILQSSLTAFQRHLRSSASSTFSPSLSKIEEIEEMTSLKHPSKGSNLARRLDRLNACVGTRVQKNRTPGYQIFAPKPYDPTPWLARHEHACQLFHELKRSGQLGAVGKA